MSSVVEPDDVIERDCQLSIGEIQPSPRPVELCTDHQDRTIFLRLMDAFLQEENIKWVLGLGVCILLGSSMRLVTLHWAEYAPTWKSLILLSYTAAVFGLGELSYHRMGLRKTGTVLMALTLLLIPISFLALHWINPGPESAEKMAGYRVELLALLGFNLVWSSGAAYRILRHFLRSNQPTFLACYVILCVAGSVVPGLPPSWGLWVSLVLWAVFTLGTVKVNRHIFWLTENHRLPRIFGFFPILLLGSQFASVFLLGVARDVTPPWLGFLATLVALPILMTADAVARVFEQRTGGLVRPIPWAISGPLACGTFLAGAGVILALCGWPASPAIVPTAVIAAIAMAVIGRRTGKSAFVWGMVACLIVAYQTSPVFFKDLVLQLRDQAAAAVRESRLPYAFYGLTYAPLISLFSIAAAWLRRRGDTLFSKPFQTVATILPWVLLATAFTHPSAIFPVSMVLCVIFSMQIFFFRDQRYVTGTAITWLAAAYGLPGFFMRVVDASLIDPTVMTELRFIIWVIAATSLLAPGIWFDNWACRIDTRRRTKSSHRPLNACQVTSAMAALLSAIGWIGAFGRTAFQPGATASLLVGGLIVLLLGCHACRWLKSGFGEITLVFANIVGLCALIRQDWLGLPFLESLCGLLLIQWVLSYLAERFSKTTLSQAFQPALLRVSMVGLLGLYLLVLPSLVARHAGTQGVPRMVSLVMVVWGLDSSRRVANRIFSTIAWSAVFGLVTAELSEQLPLVLASKFWMLAWTCTAIVLAGFRSSMSSLIEHASHQKDPRDSDRQELKNSDRYSQLEIWVSPLSELAPLAFSAVGLSSLLYLDWIHRAAGVLALTSLSLVKRSKSPVSLAGLQLPMFMWQVLAATTAVLSSSQGSVFALTQADCLNFGLTIGFLASLFLTSFESQRLRDRIQWPEAIWVHQALLLVVVCWCLLSTAWWTPRPGWTVFQSLLAGMTFVALISGTILRSLRLQQVTWVWLSQVTMASSLAYFVGVGAFDFQDPTCEFGLLFLGVALRALGHSAATRPGWRILSSPFLKTGFWTPMSVLPITLLRYADHSTVQWAGMNSLPLLGVAVFYFWIGRQRQQVGTTLFSAGLLNVAFAMLWNDLNWTDPQLFLMPVGISVLGLTQLLNREIPHQYHDRLRYLGSLIILTSPTFQIVSGSWTHILSLMVASTLLALTAIGLRIRSLLYMSSAFLVADLIALVARGSIEEPNTLWIFGVVLGGAIIALGAICENHRETVLSRLRSLAAELEQWA